MTLTLLSPPTSGNYYLSLNTYDTSKKVLETGGAMIVINAPPFVSTFMFSSHTGINTPTILAFKLISSQIIPSGLPQNDLLATRGYFQIELPTQLNGKLLFGLDLGLGLNQGDEIPCRGILIITGLNDPGLTCVITSRPVVASVGTPVIITVSNFLQIPANTLFLFYLAGLYYVQTANAPTVSITAYTVTNRIQTKIHVDSFTLGVGSAVPAMTVASAGITLSSMVVQDLSTLSFSFTTSSVGTTGSSLLLRFYPTHDSGYCSYLATKCTSLNSYSCFCFPGADMIGISLQNGLPAGTYSFTIQGLINPQSVSTADGLQIFVIDNFIIKKYQNLGSLPLLTAGVITDTLVNLDQHCAGCVNVNYEFYLRCPHSIPSQGSIIVTLDSSKGYVFHYSSPKPYCSLFSRNGIEISSYLCTPYRNYLTISGLPYIPSGQLIRLILSGVKNPSSLGSIGTILFQSMNSYSRVIDSVTLTGPLLGSFLVVADITDAVISNFPTNAGEYSEYSIFFTPIPSIGPGAIVEIDFPTKNFNSFVNPPDCRVSIGILFITNCNFDGKTFKATVNGDYHNSQIEIFILNILNFSPGTSDSFSITVIYDGVTLQKSSTSITVSTSSYASSITTSQINFYPKNEGETATYEFHITPSENIDTTSYLTIIFPKSYDKRIGDYIDCWATGLTGFIKCEVINS